MQLQHSQIWNGILEAENKIAVESGQLWLTFNGEDIVLGAGQHWIAPCQGEVMAQSLEKACFRVDTIRGASVTQSKRTWVQWYGHKWLEVLRVPLLRLHL